MIKEELFKLSLPYADKGNKTVRIFVPDHEEGETLPVIYMTDGQNLFEDTNVQFGCWYTREAVRAEKQKRGKAAIIAAIHNDGTPIERGNELTPKTMGKPFFPPETPEEIKAAFKPGGEEFDRFVVDVVMPAVEARFPAKSGRANTAFCGSSSGGLQTFFTTLSHSDIFSAAGVFSPSFVIYDKDDLKQWILSNSRGDLSAPYLYLYSGGADELEKHIAAGVEWAYDIMKEYYPPERLKKVIIPENRHHESAWETVFKDFLHFFLSQQ